MEEPLSPSPLPRRSLARFGIALVALFIALLILLALFLTGAIGGNYALLTVENATDEPLSEVKVTLLDRAYPIGELPAHSTKAILARDLEEAHWSFHGIWANGDSFDLGIGTLRRGTNFRQTLTIESREEVAFDSQEGLFP